MNKELLYIWQHKAWPKLTYDQAFLEDALVKCRLKQGILMGKYLSLSKLDRTEAELEIVVSNTKNTAEIEGENLDLLQIRSSVARSLNYRVSSTNKSSKEIEGLVSILIEATSLERVTKKNQLTLGLLYDWHKRIFPSSDSSLKNRNRVLNDEIGSLRTDSTGKMQVVSGFIGKQHIHFEAPPSKVLPHEMRCFIEWYNKTNDLDYIIKAGLAHIWFLTIHPFVDGNGRLARALTDMCLFSGEFKHTGNVNRYYSLSAQILKQRKSYYSVLEATQSCLVNRNIDVTKININEWLLWFINCLNDSFDLAEKILKKIYERSSFWKRFETVNFNYRQKKVLSILFDEFKGDLTASKWAKLTKVSQDTALRDINELINFKILKRVEGANGRNVKYELV